MRPDCSLSWSGNLRLLGLLALPLMVIATGFALQGMWMVAPFAGLELLVLTTATYHVSQKLDERELLTVDEDRILYQRGRKKIHENIQYRRAWARLRVSGQGSAWDPLRIFLTGNDKSAEIGQRLSQADRLELLQQLTRLGLRVETVAR